MSDFQIPASPATTIGRLSVVRLIAHGGMGSSTSPAILHRPHDRHQAAPGGIRDEAARERFAREARATGRLRHPNIVTVFDVASTTSGVHRHGVRAGETLEQLIRRRAPLSITDRLVILEDLCSACTSPTRRHPPPRYQPANVISTSQVPSDPRFRSRARVGFRHHESGDQLAR